MGQTVSGGGAESLKDQLVTQKINSVVLQDVKVVVREYQVAKYNDVEALKELLGLIPKLVEEVQKLKVKLAGVREYKLVEEEIRVPHVKYVPTEVERVVWKDVDKERCKSCGKVVE